MKATIIHPLNYDERPRGHEPDHFQSIADTLTSRGHSVLIPRDIDSADVLIFDSGVWNLSATETSPYDWGVLETVLHKRIPIIWMDDFDHAGDDKSHGRWPGSDDWRDMLAYIRSGNHDFASFAWAMSRPGANRILYFMRKMQKHQKYPEWVHPLEYPLFEDNPLTTKEELCSRPFDVCGLANGSMIRAIAMLGLYRDKRLNVDCEIIPSYRRLDHFVWMDRHRQAKFFLEADASLGSERPLRLITIAPMLRVKSDHKLPFPRKDMVHMVEIGDYDGAITKADVDKVLSVLNDPDLLYLIYRNGAEHMRKHYSLDARSNYVVDLIEKFIK